VKNKETNCKTVSIFMFMDTKGFLSALLYGASKLGSLNIEESANTKLYKNKPIFSVPKSTVPRINVSLGSPMEQIGKCFDDAGLLMRDALEAVNVQK